MSRTGEASLPMTRLTQRMDEKHEIPVDRDFHLPFSQAGIEPALADQVTRTNEESVGTYLWPCTPMIDTTYFIRHDRVVPTSDRTNESC